MSYKVRPTSAVGLFDNNSWLCCFCCCCDAARQSLSLRRVASANARVHTTQGIFVKCVWANVHSSKDFFSSPDCGRTFLASERQFLVLLHILGMWHLFYRLLICFCSVQDLDSVQIEVGR